MFLPLGEETIIDPIFASLETDDRVDNVYLSTNERFADDFETYLADSEFDKPTLSIEETTDEDEKFGVISALAQLVEREEITDDTIIVAGDNYLSFGVSEFIDSFVARDAPMIAAYDVGSREQARSYGVIDVEDNQVVGFTEKPANPSSSLVSIACYGFPAESVDLLETYLEEDNNPDEPGWFIQWLHDRTATYAFTFDGAWFDIGTADSYLDAVEFMLNDGTYVADSATTENVTLESGVQILEGATVTDATLTRTVVFPEASVKDASLEDSIVDSHAAVNGVSLTESTVGAHSTLNRPE
ncbi:Nucleotidyl transferase [Halorubrum coriense DSM 10284]|uniref:Nucleotidyl transferase n=2 Tax=Halorubrum coriense TaxID=64713 RepID=M0EDW7_9EURY|nr:Nucleotidyl transferase [Halorubrum coriense DSM 10284]